ncbi:MAG: 4Fe-4S binding protein [Alphaproteobacteria bacterium]|nr:4Fe-4S binding protein [Alphaproteobacteria bacterium]
MTLDGAALAKACGAGAAADVQHRLCRAQLDNFQALLKRGEPLLVACTQEAPLFDETRAEAGLGELPVRYVNIRERAGWSDEGAAATPKIAALLAEAALDIASTSSVALESKGVTLVYGRDERAIDVARRLRERLEVTVLLDRPQDVLPPRVMDVPIFKGTIVGARGHLGGFEIVVDDYAATVPSARRQLAFEAPRNGASAACDVILDLTGGTPLFAAHEKRDGYLRPDPNDPAAVERAVFDLVDLVGEFDKPRYIDFKADLCAHSRSRKTGCTRCLDLCPVGAIKPAGDSVEIDPRVCAGCGACASVCPTGAATYAMPPGDALFQRLRTVLSTYRAAGGDKPALLLHDATHGEEMIAAIARTGRGLPARVLPFALNSVTQIGFDFFACALAYGAAELRVLVGPKNRDELSGLAQQIGLAEAAMAGLGHGGGRVTIVDERDPDVVEAALYALPGPAPAPAGGFLPMGGKRTLAMLALRHLRQHAPTPVDRAPLDLLPLPQGAPFGSIRVDTAGCTLCLACVGACPTGALGDDPDRPTLTFTEDACVQCGLCKATCPEKVIALEPRFNFADQARSAVVVKREAPFHCVRCGKPFGTRGAIERIVEKLAGKHAMFAQPDAKFRLMMCEDCRAIAQFEQGNEPLAGPPRPKPRTSEDDFREREIEEARARVLAERRGKDGSG